MGRIASTRAATATFSLMSPPSPSRSSRPERRWKTSVPFVCRRGADAGRKRARQADGVRGRGGAGRRELGTGPHRRARRDPDSRQPRDGRRREALHHTPAPRHEPAVGAAAQDGGGSLRDDRDAQRVREGPVVARAHHRGERVHPRQHRRAVEPDERPSDERRKRRLDLPGDLRRAAASPRSGRLRRAPSRARAGTRRARRRAGRSRLRASGGSGRSGQATPVDAPAAGSGREGSAASLHARDGPSETGPGRHVPVFVAGPDLPTARAARARRETRPRAGGGRRTARSRDGAPRP